MPQPNIENQPTRIEIPPHIMEDPVALEKHIAQKTGQAFSQSYKEMTKLDQLKTSQLFAGLQSDKIDKLFADLETAENVMKTKLAKAGVAIPAQEKKSAGKPEISPEWTAERIEAIRANKAKQVAQEQKKKRDLMMGTLRAQLMTKDGNFNKSLGKIDPANILKIQEDKIAEMNKMLKNEFVNNKLTPTEESIIENSLPHFLESKKALINFKIKQAQDKIAMNERKKLNYSQRTLKPGGREIREDDVIKSQEKEIEKLKYELEKLQGKKAA